jgi:hypothetical protein
MNKESITQGLTPLHCSSRVYAFCLWAIFLGFLLPLSHVGAYDGYLKEGTFALNPEDKRQIFLYIPGMTPIYSISSEDVLVGTAPFSGKPKKPYRLVRTQDGIHALILKDSIRFTNSALAEFDFVINRRTNSQNSMKVAVGLPCMHEMRERFSRYRTTNTR